MEKSTLEIIPNAALQAAKAEQAEKLAVFEQRRVARSLIVPTDDNEVKQQLRARRLPICYFGEDAHDRRERLRTAMAKEKMEGAPHPSKEDAPSVEKKRKKPDEKEAAPEEREEYYTEGSQELKQVRWALAEPSIMRARKRLEAEKLLASIKNRSHPMRQRIRDEEQRAVDDVRASHLISSQVGDVRPLSAISIGMLPNTERYIIATGSWSGTVKVWDSDEACAHLQTLSTHSERISTVSIPRESCDFLLTSSADCTAAIHRITDSDKVEFKLQQVLHGHKARVTDAKMHPFRKSLVVTCSFDGSFMLYDQGKLILEQESGHNQVYRVGFQTDGGLLGTCGMDGGIRMWDLRSGRAVMTMEKAHGGDVLGVEFSGDGRVFASCGKDNIVKAWDLRNRRCSKTVAAHRGLISGMRFGGGTNKSDVLFTCSFDRTVKCWGARRSWGLLAAHTSFEDKVTAIDCSPDGRQVVTACYDKTWKLWGNAL